MVNNKTNAFRLFHVQNVIIFSSHKYATATKYILKVILECYYGKHCSSVTIPEAVAKFLDSAHNNYYYAVAIDAMNLSLK